MPGAAVAAGVFGWGAVEFARNVVPAVPRIQLQISVAAVQPLEPAGWVMAALAVSVAAYRFSRRVAG